jgi:glycosyltransferase involved in cell wall biosynthesis
MSTSAAEIVHVPQLDLSSASAPAVHVLFLIDQLCGTGGAETALLNTVRWLPRERFRSTVMAFKLDPSFALLKEFPCPVKVIPLRRTYDWNAVRMGLQLSRFIRGEKVEIVHTFFASADLWGGLVAKLSRRPVIISSRRDMGILRTGKHHRAYRTLAPVYDKVLTVSDQVRRYSIEQDGLRPDKVATIYNAVDLHRFPLRQPENVEEFRKRLGLADASHVIATVGNLRRVKGLDVLVRAAALVCREFPRAIFVVAGGSDPAEPELRQDLETLVRELGIGNNVRFLGSVADVIALLQASDLFCLLSRSEGFSNAVVEAMACGLPCVATRVGGNGEAVEHERTGFLVESEDYQSAASRICELLRDPENAVHLGANSRSFVEGHFTPDIVTSQLVKTYEELLHARASHRR